MEHQHPTKQIPSVKSLRNSYLNRGSTKATQKYCETLADTELCFERALGQVNDFVVRTNMGIKGIAK